MNLSIVEAQKQVERTSFMSLRSVTENSAMVDQLADNQGRCAALSQESAAPPELLRAVKRILKIREISIWSPPAHATFVSSAATYASAEQQPKSLLFFFLNLIY